MDIRNLNDAQLIQFALGISHESAEDLAEVMFPKNGAVIAMDSQSPTEALRERIKAAVEIDRRMALREIQTCDSPKKAKELLQQIIGSQEHESFWVVFLDSQNRVIGSHEFSIGTVSQCSVYPREVVKKAMTCNASAVMLAHNHPSGVPDPSRADEALTSTLKSALALVDVRVLDHFIMTRTSILSMAEMGLV